MRAVTVLTCARGDVLADVLMVIADRTSAMSADLTAWLATAGTVVLGLTGSGIRDAAAGTTERILSVIIVRDVNV